MSSITFSTLTSSVKARVFPFGTPENLDAVVGQLIIEALIMVQRYVSCYQQRNVDVLTRDTGTFDWCGMTVISRPRGEILEVRNRAYQSSDGLLTSLDDDCDFFTYDEVAKQEMEDLSEEFDGLDLTKCRVRWGSYSIRDGNIITVPPLQAHAAIELVWRGIKRDYEDFDWVPDDPELLEAVCAYVEMEHARKYDKDTEAFTMAKDNFRETVGEMVKDCREHGAPPSPRRDSDIVERLRIFAAGDYGLAGSAQSQVIALGRTWDPDVWLLLGDNNYPSGASDTIDQNHAALQDMIHQARVFPALGNHDLDTEDGDPQLNYFALPGDKDGRYYSFRRGNVEFFCIDSGLNTAGSLIEPDGNTQTSTQGEWLRTSLAASNARWKVVYFHHPPYTSDVNYYPGNSTLRWDFKGWGAHCVINGHGHNYERIVVDGFPYFVVGTGGHSLRPANATLVIGSKKFYNATFGALKIVADHKRLLFKFYSVAGDMQDVYVISAESTVTNVDEPDMASDPSCCVRAVDTIAALRELSTNVSIQAWVLGQFAKGDGLNFGLFLWDTSLADAIANPDDDSILIRSNVSTGGAWKKWL